MSKAIVESRAFYCWLVIHLTKESMMNNLTRAEPNFIMREKKELQKRLLDKNSQLLELMQRVEKYLMRIEK